MANLKLKNPAGGSLNLVSADGASDLTVTFPATTGTAMVSGNMPAFSAYVGTNQSVSSGTYTKVACNVEEFDTANCYNTSTYRFTPNVAGYYQFNGQTENVSGGGARIILQFYKNGAEAKRGNDLGLPSGNWASAGGMVVNALIYCNGTTDYVEFYIYDTGGQTVAGGNSAVSYFQGFLVRAA